MRQACLLLVGLVGGVGESRLSIVQGAPAVCGEEMIGKDGRGGGGLSDCLVYWVEEKPERGTRAENGEKGTRCKHGQATDLTANPARASAFTSGQRRERFRSARARFEKKIPALEKKRGTEASSLSRLGEVEGAVPVGGC